ncbi:MAG: UDP-glucose/GDP-mannose dehydrogenase family protein [Candidatus Omnitrophica bacterium]|nr:UDP-glucose/GDP-mannose dehydrogenase family protein [Candidatus Omnitrophota bacterium]
MKDISIIGSGYVGLVSGTCLAEIGHSVLCVDSDREKIRKLQDGVVPIYEPGLKELIAKNRKAGRLSFSTSVKKAVENSEIIFIAVQTPPRENGEADLYYVESVARQIAQLMDRYKVIVSKSTMPVETGKKIKETIRTYCSKDIEFDVVSNPEFLKEGSAVEDFLHPQRIVVGVETKRAEKIMRELYRPIRAPFIATNIETAEIIKHSCNAFLATKISFINALSNLCEKVGADVEEVARAMGLDKRIGRSFLKAGIGYGGSCFPKDVDAFVHIAAQKGYDFELLRVVQKINQFQKENFVKKIKKALWNLKDKKIGVLGLSFKPNTDDMRNAPSIDIIKTLIKEGVLVKAYDPAAMKKARKIFKDKIIYSSNLYETARGSDALIILTEWDEFKKMNLERIRKLLKVKIIIDGRNMFEPQKMSRLGFKYICIGR